MGDKKRYFYYSNTEVRGFNSSYNMIEQHARLINNVSFLYKFGDLCCFTSWNYSLMRPFCVFFLVCTNFKGVKQELFMHIG